MSSDPFADVVDIDVPEMCQVVDITEVQSRGLAQHFELHQHQPEHEWTMEKKLPPNRAPLLLLSVEQACATVSANAQHYEGLGYFDQEPAAEHYPNAESLTLPEVGFDTHCGNPAAPSCHGYAFVPILLDAISVFDDRIQYYRNNIFGPVLWDDTVKKLKLLFEAFDVPRDPLVLCPYGPYVEFENQELLLNLDDRLRTQFGVPTISSVRSRIQVEVALTLQQAAVLRLQTPE